MSLMDQNELFRLGKELFDSTGTSAPSEKSMISQLASRTGVAYNVARDAYVKSVLDPLIQEKVHKSMDWFIHANFVPEFVDVDDSTTGYEDSAEAFDLASLKPDGVQTPKRMFNIDTGNIEDWPSGQYVILSHSWKGDEISYPFICKVKEGSKRREVYEMVQDDEDEEASRFARFQAKKFSHLSAGKSDVELLSAQCAKDIEAQVQKIEATIARSGVKTDTRQLLAQLIELKDATWEEQDSRNSCNAKRKELELRKMADKTLEKEKEAAGVSDAQISTEVDQKYDKNENKDLRTQAAQVEEQLARAEEKMHEAEERLRRATASCESLRHNPSLYLTIQGLLPVLERKKSMNKIEGSLREAKRILDSGLFPSHNRKRYLWNDTCCINKGDANELNQSLAMMGEWYNNADFCLVHLDTASSSEWLDTWDHLEKPAKLPNFGTLDDVKKPKWATRGWTLQELVLSKMTFYVNNLWQPLTRPVEGLGSYYYFCSYLDQHIRDKDIPKALPDATTTLRNLEKLRELMDTGEKIEYIDYPGCSDLEKSLRLIGILNFLGVTFSGDMDDDSSGAQIRSTISLAAYDIESRLKTQPNSRLAVLLAALGVDTNSTSIREQARTIIKMVTRALIEDCRAAIAKDRTKVSEFTNVPESECCRGLSRSTHSAHDILSLASYRECTVPIDRVYSLMGVLGVKFAAFHAEGPTKALWRLLDEVIITSNDVSIFNWAGKNLGSPIRGRSLYPSNLTAFGPEKAESNFTARRNNVLATASKKKRFGLQDTSLRLTFLLRGTIDFLKKTAHENVPTDLTRSILDFISETSLAVLRPQLENLAKLLVYLEDTPRFEKYKSTSSIRAEEAVGEPVASESSETRNSNDAGGSVFGFKKPQMSQISAPKLKGFGGLSKRFSKEPAAVKEDPSPAPVPQPPVAASQSQEIKTLAAEINRWLFKRNINDIPDSLQELFQNLQPPNLDESVGRKKTTTETVSPKDIMVCPNPIMLTTSGIEGVFDIQRVIITMQDADSLRYQVVNAVNDSQKISGQCAISTGLSTIKADFTCTSGMLGKQLDVCDAVHQALFPVKDDRGPASFVQNLITPGQETINYYQKVTSFSSGLIRQATGTTESEESKQNTATAQAQVESYGETEDQRTVCRMLNFVQETNIDLIVGEWVLARFSGTDGAKWFLCQLELGSTQGYYGRRIATDDIDFKNVLPEPGLVGHWENYMHNKKAELCRIVNVLLQGRLLRRYADKAVGLEKPAQIKGDSGEDSDDEGSDSRRKLMEFLKQGTLASAEIMQSVIDMRAESLDSMLGDTILQRVPKELRAAIMNLNENEDLLPAMFLSGVRVHMF